ncbi:MAG: DnaJ C-terminal domain-containing protein [Chloroflexota bacterium]
MAKDYYSVLGVRKSATPKEIKSAFRKLARKHHPDVNPGDKAAEERFKEINSAHDVLSDTEKRAKYDKYGDNWEHAEAFEKARAAQGAGRGPTSGHSESYSFDINELLRRQGAGRGSGASGFDFGDVLGGIFSGGGGGGRRASRGQNVEYTTEITLEEAYNGTTRQLNLQSEEACPTCHGSGEIAGAVCHTCGGEGRVLRPKKLEVRIPAGAQTGTRVRIAGEGEHGAGGGPRGDLYVVTNVRAHAKFERKGDDLVEEVAVPVEDAVLGGEVEVPTISGKRVAMKIPAMTQSGRQIKLKGLGMPNLNGKDKGDLLARVKVVIPEDLSDDERELFSELREMRANGHKRK